jgi:DNA-binding transcriptional ArsR family regulator
MSNEEAAQSISHEKVFEILSNPVKRSILRILGERGEVSFTELRTELKTSTGNLYYNLDGMTGFIAKNEKRKYTLTEKGLKLYRFMIDEDARVRTILTEKRGVLACIEKYFIPALVPESLVAALYSEKLLSLVTLVTALLGGAISSVATLRAIFMLDQLFLPSSLQLLGAPIYFSGAALLISIVEVAQRILGGHTKWSLEYIAAIFIATLPLSMFNLLESLLPLDVLTLNILFRITQALALGLLTAALSVFRGLPKDRAFISAFIAYYASYIASLVLQRLLP